MGRCGRRKMTISCKMLKDDNVISGCKYEENAPIVDALYILT